MKVIIPIIALMFFTSALNAQLKLINPTHPGGDLNNTTINVSGTPSDTEMEIAISVINTSSTNYAIACRRTEVDVPQGTKNSTCWVLCPPYVNQGDYPILVVGGQTNIVLTESSVPGDTTTGFLAHHAPHNVDGCALYLYEWFDESNPSVALAHIYGRFTHNVSTSCTASLNETQDVNFSLYPNPANESLTIDLESIEQYDISIIDLLGKTILTNINLVNSNLNVSNLNDGVYFVSISKQGRLIKSEKLLIKH